MAFLRDLILGDTQARWALIAAGAAISVPLLVAFTAWILRKIGGRR